MASISELFGDEISDLKNHVKSEEEIKKYSTNEDMGELKRSIIENLNRLIKEQGANEELLPIILSSMDIWDDKMKVDCAKSFQKDDVIRLMSQSNQIKLMDETLNFILDADINNEELINELVKLFKILVIYLPMDHLKNTVSKRIIDLPSLKQQYPWRKIGFEMFCSIIQAKGEDGFKADPQLLKIFVNMCSDTNWRIRKQGGQFIYGYLSQLHTLKRKSKTKEEEKKTAPMKSPLRGSVQQIQQHSPQEVIRVTKSRFKSHFYDIMAELAADEELLVQIEGIEIMTEYLLVVKKKLIETDYIPNLEKIIKSTQDCATDDEVRIRMVTISGKILDRLASTVSVKQYETMFMDFFKSIIKDKNPEIRAQAAFNLPCFYFNFRSLNDNNAQYFEKLYKELIFETPNQSIEILKTLASSLHEAVSLIPYDQGTLGYLTDCINFFFNNSQKQIIEALSSNIDQIIDNVVKETDLKDLNEQIVQSQETSNNYQYGAYKDSQPKTSKTFQYQQDDIISRGGTGVSKNRVKSTIRIPDDDSLSAINPDSKPNVVRLQEYLDFNLVPESNQPEFYYSKLLDDVIVLTNNVLKGKSNWRVQEAYIMNLGKSLHNFNAIEVTDTLGSSMIEQMKSGCDQVRSSAAFFVCHLIQIQYKKQKRQNLIEQIINDFSKSGSFAHRKVYISFCIHAVSVFSFKSFRENFLQHYLALITDKVTEVRIKFLQSAPFIRPYLEQDIDLILQFNNSLNVFMTQDTQRTVTELAQKINQQLLKSKGQSNYNEAQEKTRIAYEEKLMERELWEETERKKRSEDQEDSKFDYLTLLVNTTKKYGNMRRAGGGAITFKHSLTKKNISSAGIKQFQSPPVPPQAKGSTILGSNQFIYLNSGSSQNASNSGVNSSVQLAPNQNGLQQLSVPSSTFGQLQHLKKRGSHYLNENSTKNQSGLFPPIALKDNLPGSSAVRSVRKSDLILQQQINQTQNSEVGVSSTTNQSQAPSSFAHNTVAKRSITQKFNNNNNNQESTQNSPIPGVNIATAVIPNEVQSILKRNQINYGSGSTNHAFMHSNSLGGPYSNNYLSQAQQVPVGQTVINGNMSNGSQVTVLNKKRLSSEDIEKSGTSGSISNSISRTNLNSQNQKH